MQQIIQIIKEKKAKKKQKKNLDTFLHLLVFAIKKMKLLKFNQLGEVIISEK